MEFSRQEYWNGLLFPSSGDLPHQGTELTSPTLQVYSLLLSHWGSPLFMELEQITLKFITSVAQLCVTLCNPLNCSMPGLPVHHQPPESTQTHVHCVGDAIQPSHPLLSPSPPAINLSSIRIFSNESALCIRWPKYWSVSFNISPSNEHPGLIFFRTDWLDLLAVQGTLKSLLQHHSLL